MDKKQLTELGLNEEQITKVLGLVKEGYVNKESLNQKQTELNNLTEQLKQRDEQLKSLKKFEGDNQKLQEKLTEMENTNKQKDDEYGKTLLTERKKNAIRFALMEDEAGKPYDISMVAGMFNLDTINLNEDGTIANGYKEQNETLRKDKGFLFNTQKDTKGVKKVGDTPPDGAKGDTMADTPENFGTRLAQNKLNMLGIKPKDNE